MRRKLMLTTSYTPVTRCQFCYYPVSDCGCWQPHK